MTKQRSLCALALISALFLSAQSRAGTVKCADSVRQSRIFNPESIKSDNLYRRYSYNSFDVDPRALTHLTSDPDSAIYQNPKKFKEEIKSTAGEKVEVSNRLNIEAVMKDFQLTRIQAVELQALLRRYFPKASNEDFMATVAAVRAGKSMSGTRLENIKKAKFVVALDVDGTLLDQDYQTGSPVRGVHQHMFAYGGKTHTVSMSPGWEVLIRGIKERGGSIIIFSRNSDELIQVMFESIKLDGVPLAEVADAIYSSSHMVVTPANRELIHHMKMHEVVTKDLRIAGGQKAIIIDDNPDFVFQKNQTRVVSRFDAQRIDPSTYVEVESSSRTRLDTDSAEFSYENFLSHLFSKEKKEKVVKKPKKPKVDPVLVAQNAANQREVEMISILKEIDSALNTAEKEGISFAQAYEKYSKKSYKILERNAEDSDYE